MKEIRDLLLWAREHRIQIGRLRSGDVEIELVDLELLEKAEETQAAQQKLTTEAAEPESIYQDLMRQRGRGDLAEALRDADGEAA